MAARRRESDDYREKAEEKVKPTRSAPLSCPVPSKGRSARWWGWDTSTGSEGNGKHEEIGRGAAVHVFQRAARARLVRCSSHMLKVVSKAVAQYRG